MIDLTDEESMQAYDALLDRLRELQLGWVIQQVEAAIALGKPEPRRLRKEEVGEPVWRLVSPDASGKRRGTPAVFIVAAEYTVQERLSLLIEAIRASVIEPVTFAADILAFFPESLSESGIQFIPELESVEGFAIDRAVVQSREGAAARLAGLLDELTSSESNAAPTRIDF
jgi:hypothetical protein